MELQNDVVHGTWDYPFQVHRTELQDGLYLYPHIHDELEITVITRGRGIFCVNGQEYDVKVGDIILAAPRAIHLAYATDCEPAAFFSIVFSEACFSYSKDTKIYKKYVLPVMDRAVQMTEYMNQTEDWHKEVLRLAIELDRLYFEPDTEMLCHSRLFELWDILCKNGTVVVENVKWKQRDDYLKDCIRFMHENYVSSISIKELADIAHMSEGHFSRVFHEYMKMTPIEYLMHIRIASAAQMLIGENTAISEIALRCGFNDFSYFGKQFKKEMGVTPRAYRKKA